MGVYDLSFTESRLELQLQHNSNEVFANNTALHRQVKIA